MTTGLTRGVLLSITQSAISAVLLFLLYRYLLHQLGAAQLGLWALMLASTSLARLTDLGLTAGVVRFVALCRAKGDNAASVTVIETAAISLAVVVGGILVVAYPGFEALLRLVVPEEEHTAAISLLPWAMASFWLGSISGAYQSGLEGCQRYDTRSVILLAGNLAFLLGALILAPKLGILGLAFGQVIQGLALLIAFWFFLRRQLLGLHYVPRSFSWASLKEMLTYSIRYQASGVLLALFEPLTKILLGKFGTLPVVAYYEMASQIVNKLRGLFYAANQPTAAVVATMQAKGENAIQDLYKKQYDALFLLALPLSTGLIGLMPFLSSLWIGKYEPIFVVLASSLLVVHFLFALSIPATLHNIGLGHLGANLLANLTLTAVTVGAGLVLGNKFGWAGVFLASCAAVTLSSAILLFYYARKQGIRFSDMVPSGQRASGALSFGTMILLLFPALSSDHSWPAMKLMWGLGTYCLLYVVLTAKPISNLASYVRREERVAL